MQNIFENSTHVECDHCGTPIKRGLMHMVNHWEICEKAVESRERSKDIATIIVGSSYMNLFDSAVKELFDKKIH